MLLKPYRLKLVVTAEYEYKVVRLKRDKKLTKYNDFCDGCINFLNSKCTQPSYVKDLICLDAYYSDFLNEKRKYMYRGNKVI